MSTDAEPEPHHGPYKPADLAAMPDDGQRYELIDGALIVSWSRIPLHQLAAGRLCNLLNAAAPSGLAAVCSIDVRCGPNTVLVPDVVVLPSSVVDDPDHVVTADDVALVAEIAWPSAARIDWWLKRRLYADVWIPAYLLVELEVPNITWFAPPASGIYAYEQHGKATGDQELQVTGPFEIRIVPAELVRLPGTLDVTDAVATHGSRLWPVARSSTS